MVLILMWTETHIHIDKDDDNHNECRVGVNIGGGADFALTSSWIRISSYATNWSVILIRLYSIWDSLIVLIYL